MAGGAEGAGIAVTALDGTVTTQTDMDALGEQIGRMLAAVVTEERAALPAGIPHAEEAWSVEDFDGAWAFLGPPGDDL